MKIVQEKRSEIRKDQEERVIKFLVEKGILAPGFTSFKISYDDKPGKDFDLVQLFVQLLQKEEFFPFHDILMKVKQFHDTYNIPIEDKPVVIEVREGAVRLNLMYEEMIETQDATRKEDLVEVFDGIGDQLYILAGTILKYGMQDVILKGFNAIHDSNMTKLSEDGSPIYRKGDGKVMKGPFYKPPTEDLIKILQDESRRDNN